MIERVVAPGFPCRGNAEFEVQPLRVLRRSDLDETANYSPPVAEPNVERCLRPDAIAKNFFWSMSRDFMQDALARGSCHPWWTGWRNLFGPQVQDDQSSACACCDAALGLGVAQHPKSMKAVSPTRQPGLRQFVAEGFQGRRINTPLVLPEAVREWRNW